MEQHACDIPELKAVQEPNHFEREFGAQGQSPQLDQSTIDAVRSLIRWMTEARREIEVQPDEWELLEEAREQRRRHLREKASEFRAAQELYERSIRMVGQCNRPAAEEAVTKLYQKHGRSLPQFVWFDSPRDGLAAMLLLKVMLSSASKISPQCEPHAPFVRLAGIDLKWLAVDFAGRLIEQRSPCDYDEERLILLRDHHVNLNPLRNIGLGLVRTFERAATAAIKPILTYPNRAALQLVWEQVHAQLRKHSQLAEAWNEFGSYLRTLDEHQYGQAITERPIDFILIEQPSTLRFGDLVTKYSFSLAHFEHFIHLLGLPVPDSFNEFRNALTECNWWAPMEGLCLMIDGAVEVNVDEAGLLHADDDMSVKFSDGWGVYTIHGVSVPEKVMQRSYSLEDIEAESNLEVRRIMIERYGLQKYLLEAQAVEIQADEFGTLYRKEQFGDEPLVMVQVRNSTPEPDGTFASYFLRVPPAMTTAKSAVAWTFGLGTDEYAPTFET